MERLKFEGIEITGSLKSFIEKLVSKGFEVKVEQMDNAFLKGTYAGIPDVSILVTYDDLIDDIKNVIVCLSQKDNWYELKNEYYSLKYKLMDKYGEPSENVEIFKFPYEEGFGNELDAISSGYGFYFTTFTLSNGEIQVIISPDASVSIKYSDSITAERLKEFELDEDEDILLDDYDDDF